MKKIICTALLCFSPLLLASEARVLSLGGATAMLPKDDTNIDLFPQHIDNWELFRISDVNGEATQTDTYSVVIGEPGDKWGMYGGQNESGDFIDVYRSLNKGRAIKAGLTLSTDKSTVGATETEYTNIGINATLGENRGDTELAYTLMYTKDPAAAVECTGFPTINGTCGKATPSGNSKSYKELLLRADIRRPQKVAIFKDLYAVAFLDRSSATTDIGATDISQKTTTLGASALLFNQKSINTKDLFVYGISANFFYSKTTGNVGAANTDIKDFALGGITARFGLEKDIHYGVLRFGVVRAITIYESNKDSSGGVTNDSSGIGQNGGYQISTGWGFNYQGLQIDITLNKLFYESGPQMVFDGAGANPLGTRADIVYSF